MGASLPIKPIVDAPARRSRTRLGSVGAYARRNPNLAIGLALVLILILVGLVGPQFVDVTNAQTGVGYPRPATIPDGLPLGSDDHGRDLLAVARPPQEHPLPDALRLLEYIVDACEA